MIYIYRFYVHDVYFKPNLELSICLGGPFGPMMTYESASKFRDFEASDSICPRNLTSESYGRKSLGRFDCRVHPCTINPGNCS